VALLLEYLGIVLIVGHLWLFLGLIEVVFAIVVAWLLLGELPTSMQLGGGALIIAGVALVRVDELRRAAARGSPSCASVG
jgi:drug/metabolite transporter (DMT)-like permease